MNNTVSHPILSNQNQEISLKLLENPTGQSAAKLFKPLKEDSDYLIYEDGKLYSKKMKRFLTGKVDNVGYQVYRLAIYNPLTSKMGKMLYAHRLVAEYFLPNPNNLPYVHHKDENRLNNNVNNLEWVDAKQNMAEHNKIHQNKKYRKPRYKLENLENEEWRIVLENPLYSVSNYGRVVNNQTNRLLRFDETQKYTRVSFNDKKHYFVHRLVYCTFNNDYDLNGFVIDHIDSNPRNNCLSNLQKVTHSENNYKRFK